MSDTNEVGMVFSREDEDSQPDGLKKKALYQEEIDQRIGGQGQAYCVHL